MEDKIKKNVDEEFISDYQFKIEPADKINFKHLKIENNWDFFFNAERMFSSKELDMLLDKIKTNRLPEMFYGNNRFLIANYQKNFLLEINPLHIINLCCYEERKERYIDIEKFQMIKKENIFYIPNELNFQLLNNFNKANNKNQVHKIEDNSDWSFSSPYMGTISKLTDSKIFDQISDKFSNYINNTNINIKKEDEFNFDILEINILSDNETSIEYDKYQKVGTQDNDFIVIEPTKEEIPTDKLGKENPILHFFEIKLFDDNLNDSGLAQGNFRFTIEF